MNSLIDEGLDLDFNNLADSLQDVVDEARKDAIVAEDLSTVQSEDSEIEQEIEYVTGESSQDFSQDLDYEESELEDLDAELDEIFNQNELIEDEPENVQEDPDDVCLESVEDSDFYAEIQYPCLILNGASTVEEIDFLKTFSTEPTHSKAIYLYCEAKQGVCEVGYVKLNLNFLLTLSRMPGYTLSVLGSENSKRVSIDLASPDSLVKFVAP